MLARAGKDVEPAKMATRLAVIAAPANMLVMTTVDAPVLGHNDVGCGCQHESERMPPPNRLAATELTAATEPTKMTARLASTVTPTNTLAMTAVDAAELAGPLKPPWCWRRANASSL